MSEPISAYRKQRQRGSAIVEFGLVLLPMFALLFMTLDVAWVIFGWACIQEATREGVRYAITCKSDTDIKTQVRQYSFGFVNAANVDQVVSVQYSTTAAPLTAVNCGAHCAGYVVRVNVNGISVKPLAPLWRSSAPMNLAASASDIVESNPACQ